MGGFLETLYDILFHPADALRKVSMERKTGQSAGAFLISILVPSWAAYFGLQSAGFQVMAGVAVFIQIIVSTVLWFIGAGFFALLAELFGGHGTAAGLLAGMGFAHFPRIFIAPLLVLSTLLPNPIQPLFIILSGSIIVIWIIILHVLAIREAYVLTTLRAVMVAVAPLAAIIACGVVILLSVGTMLLQGISWL